MSQTDLNDLHARVANGEIDLESELFRVLDARFRMFVRRRVANQEDGEEIVQNALMTISTEYKQLEIRVSFAAWAYQVLNNRLRAYVKDRGRKMQRTVSLSQPEGSIDPPVPESDPALKRQLMHCLQKISQVNPRYLRVLKLKVQGYQTDEICDQLELTSTNLYSMISRARTMLENCLEKGELS